MPRQVPVFFVTRKQASRPFVAYTILTMGWQTGCMRAPVSILLAVAAVPVLSGCVTAAIATGAGVGLMVAQDRTLGAGLDDNAAFAELKGKLLSADARGFQHVDIKVSEGLVLLTGVVPTAEHKAEAERLAWSMEQVDEVGNELSIGVPGGVLRAASDDLIVTQIISRIVSDSSVKGINFNVNAHDGVVYLTGRARSQEELDRVAEIASLVRGVTRVVSYMDVRRPRPGQLPVADTVSAPVEEPLPSGPGR
jgi:osmotically-inducible protein OsmY